MNALVKKDQVSLDVMSGLKIESFQDLMSLGDVFVKSGFFRDTKDASQAIVKILYGQELGFSPIVSMLGINVIEGKPALSANMVATLINKSNRYSFRVIRSENDGCELEWFENGQSVGKNAFTVDDAKRAGLTNKQNWARYPKAMLFNRALTAGQKLFAPDVSGCPIYTPEELGAEVDSEGKMVSHPIAEPKRSTQPLTFKRDAQPVPITGDPLPLSPDEPVLPIPTSEPISATPTPTPSEYISTDDAKELHFYCYKFLPTSCRDARNHVTSQAKAKCDEWIEAWARSKELKDENGRGTLKKVKRIYETPNGPIDGITRMREKLKFLMEERIAEMTQSQSQ